MTTGRKSCSTHEIRCCFPGHCPPTSSSAPWNSTSSRGCCSIPSGAIPWRSRSALQGAGGFGKTTLAAALCHDDDVKLAFGDGILWVTLGAERLTSLPCSTTSARRSPTGTPASPRSAPRPNSIWPSWLTTAIAWSCSTTSGTRATWSRSSVEARPAPGWSRRGGVRS